MKNKKGCMFLTAILHRGLRNCFFFRLHLLFPYSFWIFIFLFSLDFYFPFLFGLLFPFYFSLKFYFPFFFGLLFNRGHILDFFNTYSNEFQLKIKIIYFLFHKISHKLKHVHIITINHHWAIIGIKYRNIRHSRNPDFLMTMSS